MQTLNTIKYLFSGIFIIATAITAIATNLGAPAIIPAPEKMDIRDGAFQLTPKTRLYVDPASREAGNILSERLHKSTGYPLKVSTKFFASTPANGAILLTTKNVSTNLRAEGYELTVASNSVVIR